MATIQELAEQGIERMRLPSWRSPTDYIKIDFIHGGIGPWVHLYSRLNEVVGSENPRDILFLDTTGDKWEPYTGEIDPDEG